MKITDTTTYNLDHSCTLEDLRLLVEDTANDRPDQKVSVGLDQFGFVYAITLESNRQQ
jgi:hypothetical protein